MTSNWNYFCCRDSVQNPITRITVSGQITEIYITDSRKTEAKNAVNAALYTQDDSYIHERATYRNTEFAAQVERYIFNVTDSKST